MPNIPLAKQLIEQAADLCVSTTVTADKHDEYVKRRDAKVIPKSNPITTSTEFVLTEAKGQIGEHLTEADKQAKKHDYVKAHGELDNALVKSEKAAALKEANTKYINLLGVVTGAVNGLTISTPPGTDPVIGIDITALNQKITKAGEEALKPAYDKAMKLLDEVETGEKAAAVKKKMKGNNPPTEGELTTLISKPGGTKLLDDIVAGLGATAQQAVLLLAMKVRFGLEGITSIAAGVAGTTDVAESGTTADADLALSKIYSLMTKVPDKHTKDNPSFKKIKRYAGLGEDGTKSRTKGDYYDPTDKEIVLSVGSPDVYPYTLQDPTELPDITDPNCQPVDNVPPKHFDNNTLHEAAHAIDDKKGFMNRNASGADYGGWIEHNGDVMPAALAAAKALKYDAGYIAKYLLKETGIVEPPPPSGTELTVWQAARDKAKTWADAIRFGQNPWANGTACRTAITAGGFVIEGRVYHEGYDGYWYSYLAEKRKQGVTGYQFRAPGEWFAELYASYGNRKLKKSHPAVTLFLGKMFPLNPPLP